VPRALIEARLTGITKVAVAAGRAALAIALSLSFVDCSPKRGLNCDLEM
jgi:hypothetical protein